MVVRGGPSGIITAALCARKDIPVTALDTALLRKVLMQQGAIVARPE